MREAIEVTICVACYQQKPDVRHIDFEASFDGPVLRTGPEDAPIPVSIDELIICEECVKIAALYIGYVDGEELKKENKELGRSIERRDEQIESDARKISNLEHTLSEQMKNPVKRPAGKRKMLELPEEKVS